jgi:hypothetical protein
MHDMWIVSSVFLLICWVGSESGRRGWKREAEARLTRVEGQRFRDQADLQQRRADEFFGIIQGIEVERDTWRGFYAKSSHHAGVAQAWLIRDLSNLVIVANRLAARLREKGEKVPPIHLDKALQQIVDEFTGTFTAPEKMKVAQAPGFAAAEQAEAGFKEEALVLDQDRKTPDTTGPAVS